MNPPAPAIRGFTGAYHFLSNFDMTPFVYRGATCASGEHAFQADKFFKTDPAQYQVVLDALSPSKAKYHGRNQSIPIQPGWDDGVAYSVMADVVAAKFGQNPRLRDALLATGRAWLEEETTWHDNVWGNCVCGNADGRHPGCLEPGKNYLGLILMALRGAFSQARQEEELVEKHRRARGAPPRGPGERHWWD